MALIDQRSDSVQINTAAALVCVLIIIERGGGGGGAGAGGWHPCQTRVAAAAAAAQGLGGWGEQAGPRRPVPAAPGPLLSVLPTHGAAVLGLWRGVAWQGPVAKAQGKARDG